MTNPAKKTELTNADIKWINKTMFLVISFIIVATAVPLLIAGDAGNFSGFVKYRTMDIHTCYGGQNLTNYQVTPSIYNTTLTYWPAYLQAFTVAKSRSDPTHYFPVMLSYPTLFERQFDCYCSSKYDDRCPCDKMVGDVISKYNELHDMATFDCYIDGNTIVGLSDEQSIIKFHYNLSTAGIVIMVFYACYCIFALAVACECICYIPKKQLPRATVMLFDANEPVIDI